MSDKVYYEIEGEVRLPPVKVKVEVTARTEPGSVPARALRQWLRNGDRLTFRDADIESTSFEVANPEDFLGDDDEALEALTTLIVRLHEAGRLSIQKHQTKVLDAK